MVKLLGKSTGIVSNSTFGHIPRLRAYIAAILNWNEKDLWFLPCNDGYLVLCTPKTGSLLMWVHRLTIETTLNVVFQTAKEMSEDFFFGLFTGGRIIQEVLKSKFPDPPKNTLVFLPHLHQIEYGTVVFVDPDGKMGSALEAFSKGVAKASNILERTGTSIIDVVAGNVGGRRRNLILQDEQKGNKPNQERRCVFIQLFDRLYLHLAKDTHLKEKLPPSSGVTEFRTFFDEEAAKFLKLLEEKGNFKLIFKDEKTLLRL